MFVILPPYGSIVGILRLLYVCFYCLYSNRFLSGVKLCMLVLLLSSGMSLSHFGELWLTWSHGGSITSGMRYGRKIPERSLGSPKLLVRLLSKSHPGKNISCEARWAVRIEGAHRIRPYGGICILQACCLTCCDITFLVR